MKKRKILRPTHAELLAEYNRGYTARMHGKRRIAQSSLYWLRGWSAADREIKREQRRAV
ncbi:MAG: hypothetical protein AB7V46_19525 [Thermomicrobiales bacterium]